MTLAIKRLRNIGWLALVFLISIMLYPLSLNVAAVHSDLMRVDREIRDTKREISFLQAELRTRASPQQLEEWNNLLYGYKPPTAQQFLEGEHALAELNGDAPTIKPVLVAVADSVVPADDAIATDAVRSSFAPVGRAISKPPSNKAGEGGHDGALRFASAQAKDIANGGSGNARSISDRTIKLAAIDAKILSDDLLRDIEKRALRERNAI